MKEIEDKYCSFCKKEIKNKSNSVKSGKKEYKGTFCNHICYIKYRKSFDSKWSEDCGITIINWS